VYGPGDNFDPNNAMVIPSLLHRIANGEDPMRIWGDGSAVRDYIYISDVADAFAAAVDYDGDERIFNISSGHGTSLNELIAMIEATLGQSVARQYLPGRPIDVPVSILCNALARRELGWSPKVDLAAGLARTAHWMRDFVAT
jgi:UDP-glucose 4-epimerase